MGIAPFRRRKSRLLLRLAWDNALPEAEGITKLLFRAALSHACSLCGCLRATFSPALFLFVDDAKAASRLGLALAALRIYAGRPCEIILQGSFVR